MKMNFAVCVAVLAACAASVGAATIQVGPTRTYTTIPAGYAAASPGDTIEIDAATYTGPAACCVTIYKNNLTIRGVGPTRPILDANYGNVGDKGIFVVYAANLTVENLEMKNTRGPSGNDAGVRYQPQSQPALLTLRNCYIHDNQDGVLTDGGSQVDIIFEYCEFDHNGNVLVQDGQTHNIYIGTARTFTMRYCYSHDTWEGHEVKTRAYTNYILYNLLSSENGTGSRELQLANGGTAYVIGNVIQQGPNSHNSALVVYGGEGTNPNPYVYVVNNTLINLRSDGATFFQKNNATTEALFENNIVQWFGYETVVSGSGVTQITNWITTNAHLVNIAGHDYHLTSASTGAINLGTAPGLGYNSYSLTPVYQYVHPCARQDRPTDATIDIGAYEYGSPNQPPSVNAGNDQTITLPAAANLDGTVSDDGLPNPPGAVTVTWTKFSGPGTVVFGNPNAVDTTATFSASGTYVLRLTANDGAAQASDDVTVTANAAPTVSAGNDQTITLPAAANLDGTVSDDGLPNPPGAVTVNWTKFSGPGTVVFGNPNAVDTTATFSTNGTYVLRLTANDGAAQSADDVTITVNAPPTVNAGPDQNTYEGNPVALHATASDPDSDPLSYAWSQTAGLAVALAGANTADASFSAPTVASVAEAGLTFRVDVSDGRGGQANDSVNVRVYLRGDVDHGDSVDIFDVIDTITAFGTSSGDPDYNANADFDGNGTVDIFDVIDVVGNFGRTIE